MKQDHLIPHAAVVRSLLVAAFCFWSMAGPVFAEGPKTNNAIPKPEKKPPLAIEGFSVGDHKAFLISATNHPSQGHSALNKVAGEAAPWVWYAPIQGADTKPGGHLTWMFEKFLEAGISIAGMNTSQPYPLYGGPEDRTLFTALYEEMKVGWDEAVGGMGFHARPEKEVAPEKQSAHEKH